MRYITESKFCERSNLVFYRSKMTSPVSYTYTGVMQHRLHCGARDHECCEPRQTV